MSSRLADLPGERAVHDPLDLQIDRLTTSADTREPVHGPARRTRDAWSSGAYSSALLLIGMALGPSGLGILSDTTLSLVDPVVPVALAAIGVLTAFEIDTMSWLGRRGIAAGTLQALLAGAVVAGGTFAIVTQFVEATAATPWIVAAALGVCASTSSTLIFGDAATRSSLARAIDVDAFVPLIAGGLLIVAIHERAWLPALALTAQLAGIAITVAIIGSLLLTRTELDTEQRVFGAATLLLLGGVADYLSLSALMAGLVAGAIWNAAGGAPRESLRRDLAHLQHPLVALILLVAGAQTTFTPEVIGLAVAYVLLRGIGKLAGGLAAGLMDAGAAPRVLLPGVLGVAFALNAVRAAGPEISFVLSVAVLGTIGSQLLAGMTSPEASE